MAMTPPVSTCQAGGTWPCVAHFILLGHRNLE